jgi:glycerol kinase
LGAAFLAGLGAGVWSSTEEVASAWRSDATFEPAAARDRADELYDGWLKAVERVKGWAEGE